MKRSVPCALLLAAGFLTNALADAPSEHALMGRSIYSAFTCSVLASLMEEEKEHERLFTYGYEQGRVFVDRVRSGKITNEELRKSVPMGVSMYLRGPSSDFILGRIYSDAEDWALEKTASPDAEVYSESRRNSARSKYLAGNCALIGRAK